MGNGTSGAIVKEYYRKNGFDANFKKGRQILENVNGESPRDIAKRRETIAVTDRISVVSSALETNRSNASSVRRGTVSTLDQPRPLPPRTSKKNVLKNVDFTDIDYIVSQAPLEILTKTIWDVVEYLVLTPDGKQIGDLLKIRAIFRWMTSYDVYSIDAEMIPPTNSPLEHMLKIQCGLETHAQLLYSLCLLADLPCVIINGVTKSGAYEVGNDIDYEESCGQWNAVYINGQWRLVDTFWASTCVSGGNENNTLFIDTNGTVTRRGDIDDIVKFNEFYFLTDPEYLIYTHYPDDEMWQLLHEPIAMSKFITMPFLREYFHIYEMSTVEKSSNQCKLFSDKETVNITFNLQQKRSPNLTFRFMLTQHRTQIETNKPVDILLERFVSVIHSLEKVTFKIRLPFYGKYQYDVYACDFTKTTNFSLLATYMIDCVDPKDQCLPFPDCPEIGFGNNPHADKLGIYAISPTTPFVKTGNGILEFVVHVQKQFEMSHMLKSLLIDPSNLSRHVLTRREGDRYLANVKLPREGEYAIKFYVEETSGTITQNLPSDLLNFIIKFKGDDRPCNLPFPNIPDGKLGAKLDAISLGVKYLNERGDIIKAPEGKANLRFQSDKQLKLLCELSCCKREGNTRVSVISRVENDIWSFDVNMPIEGEYSVNVFAFKNTNDTKLYQIHSFFIHSDGNVTRKVRFKDDNFVENLISETIITSDSEIRLSIPKPMLYEKIFTTIRKTDEKFYEDGKGLKAESVDDMILATLNDYGEYLLEVFVYDKFEDIIATTGRFYIHRKREDDIFEDDFQELVNTLKPRNDTMPIEEPIPDRQNSVFEQGQFEEICSEDSDSDNAEVDEDDDEVISNEYQEIEAVNEDIKSLVISEETTSGVITEEAMDLEQMDPLEEAARERYKKVQEKSIKKKMAKALKSKDLCQLKSQLKKFREVGLDPDDKIYVYTQNVVKGLIAKEKMAEACRLRDPKVMEKYIERAEDVNYDHQLDMQISLTKKILQRVREIERLTKPLLIMNQNILTEMKKYQTPHESVLHVLKATCILLGDNPKSLKTWKECQAILFKTGKEHIMRRVTLFDINTVTPEMMTKIKKILEPYSFVQIRDVSKGAATFYNWVTGILNQIQNRSKIGKSERPPKSSRPRPAMLSAIPKERTVVRI